MMKNLISGLLGLAAVAFVLGFILKAINKVIIGAGPVGFWRITVALLLFALALVLIQIRDAQK